MELDANHCVRTKSCTATFFSLLHSQAIERGDKDYVEKWLETETPKLNHLRARPSWDRHSRAKFCRRIIASGTALHWAAYYGQLDITKLLIDSGASMSLNDVLLMLVVCQFVC